MFEGDLRAHCYNVLDAVSGAVEGVARGTPEGLDFAIAVCNEAEPTAARLLRALQHDTGGVIHASASDALMIGAGPAGPATALRNAQAFCVALRRVPDRCTTPTSLPAGLDGSLVPTVTGTITMERAYRLALEARPCPPPRRPRWRAGLALSAGVTTSMIAGTRERFAPAAVSVNLGALMQVGRWHLSLRGLVEVSPFGVTYNGAPTSQVATLVGARAGVGYAVVPGARAQLVVGLDVGGGYFTRTLLRGDLPSNAALGQDSGVFLAGGFARLQVALSERWSLLAEAGGSYRLFTSINQDSGNDFTLSASIGGGYAF